MIIFYDVLAGTHDLTEDWIVTSLSMVLVADNGTIISEHDVRNPFIWGSPSLIYVTLDESQGTSEYFDWHAPVTDAVNDVLQSAINYIEENQNDSDLTIITWNGYDYLPSSLSDFTHEKLAPKLDLGTVSLKDYCLKKGIPLSSLNTSERVKSLMQVYYNSTKRLT